jgi:hypothetical protein
MSVLTTGICNSFKAEIMQGGHCLNAPMTSLVGAGANAAFTITGLATTAGIAVGMAAGGTNVAAGAIVASVDSISAVTVSKAHTGTVTSGTISFTGDALKLALVKVAASRTYDNTQTNIGTPGTSAGSTSNLGTDECAATGGYSAGGIALVNTTPVVVSGTGVGTFSNVSWSSATISTTGAIIYNNGAARLGAGATPLSGRTISCHDFGGTQTVTSGTLTLAMPTADQTTGLLRIA